MSTSPIGLPSSLVNHPSTAANNSNSSSAQSAVDALGNPDTFMQLLVAQLQYQDPQSPADGTAFVTQLATFSGVEEQSAMRGDLDSINTVAQKWATALSSPPAANPQAAPATPADPAGTSPTNSTSGAAQ